MINMMNFKKGTKSLILSIISKAKNCFMSISSFIMNALGSLFKTRRMRASFISFVLLLSLFFVFQFGTYISGLNVYGQTIPNSGTITNADGDTTSSFTYTYNSFTKEMVVTGHGTLPPKDNNPLTNTNLPWLISSNGSKSDQVNKLVFLKSGGDIYLPSDSSYYFSNMSTLTSIDLSRVNTSNVTNFSCMFSESDLITYIDVTGFDTSSATNMYRMFYKCKKLMYLDVSCFNTSHVTNMLEMFDDTNILYLDLSNFDDSSVIPDANGISLRAYYCSNTTFDRSYLSKVILPDARTNKFDIRLHYGDDIPQTRTIGKNGAYYLTGSSVTNFPITVSPDGTAIAGSTNITNLNDAKYIGLGHLGESIYNSNKAKNPDYIEVDRKNNIYKAYYYKITNNVVDLKTGNSSSIGHTMHASDYAYLADGLAIVFDLSTKDIKTIFSSTYDTITKVATSLSPIFVTSSNTNFATFFSNLPNLRTIDMSSLAITSIPSLTSNSLYGGSNQINRIILPDVLDDSINIPLPETDSVWVAYDSLGRKISDDEYTNIVAKRSDASGKIYELRLKDVHVLYTDGAKIYQTNKLIDNGVEDRNVLSWDISLNHDESLMAYMFSDGLVIFEGQGENVEYYSVTEVPWINQGATRAAFSTYDNDGFVGFKPTSISYFFKGMNSVDLNRLNTEEVVSMNYTFKESTMSSLDLTSFITSNVTSMIGTFANCANLASINFGSTFDVSSVTDFTGTFFGCTSLATLNLNSWITSSAVTMEGMFGDCKALTNISSIENFTTTNVTNMKQMFYNCMNLGSMNLSSWNTENVTNMSSMFANYGASLSTLGTLNITGWNTSNVTDMSSMFSLFNGNITGLSDLDTANVNTMQNMFSYSTFASLNLSNFDTSKCNDFSSMFLGMPNITSIDISDFETNSTDQSNINMQMMFAACNKLSSIDMTGVISSKVTDIMGIFAINPLLSQVTFGTSDASSITNAAKAFRECPSIVNLDLSSLSSFAPDNVLDMFGGMTNLEVLDISSMDLRGASDNPFKKDGYIDTLPNLTEIILPEGVSQGTALPNPASVLGKFKDKNGTKYDNLIAKNTASDITYIKRKSNLLYEETIGSNSYRYYRDKVVKNGVIDSTITRDSYNLNSDGDLTVYYFGVNDLLIYDGQGNIDETLINSSYETIMKKGRRLVISNDGFIPNTLKNFFEDSNLTSCDFTRLDSTNITNISHMFDGSKNLVNIDLSFLDSASNITDLSYALANLNVSSIDVTKVHTSNAVNVEGMFSGCINLTSIEGLNTFDTSKVTNMKDLFNGSEKLTNIDISSFNTSLVTTMSGMFQGTNISNIDITNMVTTSLTDTSYMFSDLKNSSVNIILNNQAASKYFDTTSITNMSHMFDNSQGITTLDVSKFNTANVSDITNLFNGTKLTSINLESFDLSSVVDSLKCMNALNIDTLNDITLPSVSCDIDLPQKVAYAWHAYKSTGAKASQVKYRKLISTDLIRDITSLKLEDDILYIDKAGVRYIESEALYKFDVSSDNDGSIMAYYFDGRNYQGQNYNGTFIVMDMTPEDTTNTMMSFNTLLLPDKGADNYTSKVPYIRNDGTSGELTSINNIYNASNISKTDKDALRNYEDGINTYFTPWNYMSVLYNDGKITHKVTRMFFDGDILMPSSSDANYAFAGLFDIDNLYLTNINYSNVTNFDMAFSYDGYYSNNASIEFDKDYNFNVKKKANGLITIRGMFKNAGYKANSIDIKLNDFLKDASSYDLSEMFYNVGARANICNLDIGSLKIYNEPNLDFTDMFSTYLLYKDEITNEYYNNTNRLGVLDLSKAMLNTYGSLKKPKLSIIGFEKVYLPLDGGISGGDFELISGCLYEVYDKNDVYKCIGFDACIPRQKDDASYIKKRRDLKLLFDYYFLKDMTDDDIRTQCNNDLTREYLEESNYLLSMNIPYLLYDDYNNQSAASLLDATYNKEFIDEIENFTYDMTTDDTKKNNLIVNEDNIDEFYVLLINYIRDRLNADYPGTKTAFDVENYTDVSLFYSYYSEFIEEMLYPKLDHNDAFSKDIVYYLDKVTLTIFNYTTNALDNSVKLYKKLSDGTLSDALASYVSDKFTLNYNDSDNIIAGLTNTYVARISDLAYKTYASISGHDKAITINKLDLSDNSTNPNKDKLVFKTISDKTYTGSNIVIPASEIGITYTNNYGETITLTKDKDYTVSGPASYEAGTRSITYQGIGNVTGSRTINFNVVREIDLQNKDYIGTITKTYDKNNKVLFTQNNNNDFMYLTESNTDPGTFPSGSNIKIKVTGTYDDELASDNKDVTLSYSLEIPSNLNSACYKLKDDSCKTSYKGNITKRVINVTVDNSSLNKTYDGNNTVTIKLNSPSNIISGDIVNVSSTLSATYDSANASNSKKPITITDSTYQTNIGNSNYILNDLGSLSGYIYKKNINDNDITFDSISDKYINNPEALDAEIILKDTRMTPSAYTLIQGTSNDYTIKRPASYRVGTNAGWVEVTCTSNSNYTGTRKVNYNILAVNMDPGAITTNVPTGVPYIAKVYEVADVKDLITIQDTTPGLTPKNLIFNKDYKLVFNGRYRNVSDGPISVSIIGMGDYTGTITENIPITKKSFSLSDVILPPNNLGKEYKAYKDGSRCTIGQDETILDNTKLKPKYTYNSVSGISEEVPFLYDSALISDASKNPVYQGTLDRDNIYQNLYLYNMRIDPSFSFIDNYDYTDDLADSGNKLFTNASHLVDNIMPKIEAISTDKDVYGPGDDIKFIMTFSEELNINDTNKLDIINNLKLKFRLEDYGYNNSDYEAVINNASDITLTSDGSRKTIITFTHHLDSDKLPVNSELRGIKKNYLKLEYNNQVLGDKVKDIAGNSFDSNSISQANLNNLPNVVVNTKGFKITVTHDYNSSTGKLKYTIVLPTGSNFGIKEDTSTIKAAFNVNVINKSNPDPSTNNVTLDLTGLDTFINVREILPKEKYEIEIDTIGKHMIEPNDTLGLDFIFKINSDMLTNNLNNKNIEASDRFTLVRTVDKTELDITYEGQNLIYDTSSKKLYILDNGVKTEVLFYTGDSLSFIERNGLDLYEKVDSTMTRIVSKVINNLTSDMTFSLASIKDDYAHGPFFDFNLKLKDASDVLSEINSNKNNADKLNKILAKNNYGGVRRVNLELLDDSRIILDDSDLINVFNSYIDDASNTLGNELRRRFNEQRLLLDTKDKAVNEIKDMLSDLKAKDKFMDDLTNSRFLTLDDKIIAYNNLELWTRELIKNDTSIIDMLDSYYGNNQDPLNIIPSYIAGHDTKVSESRDSDEIEIYGVKDKVSNPSNIDTVLNVKRVVSKDTIEDLKTSLSSVLDPSDHIFTSYNVSLLEKIDVPDIDPSDPDPAPLPIPRSIKPDSANSKKVQLRIKLPQEYFFTNIKAYDAGGNIIPITNKTMYDKDFYIYLDLDKLDDDLNLLALVCDKPSVIITEDGLTEGGEVIPNRSYPLTNQSLGVNIKLKDKIYKALVNRDGNLVSTLKQTGSYIISDIPSINDNVYLNITYSKKSQAELDEENKDGNKKDIGGVTFTVQVANHRAYIDGYSDMTFRPNEYVTRAEFSKMIAVLSENYQYSSPEDNKKYIKGYKDVKENSWYSNYIGYLLKTNIMKGYNDKTFKPNGKLTRAEACKVLSDMYGISTNELNIYAYNKFSNELDNKWYENSVKKLLTNNYINGYPDGTFKAQSNISRAEVVSLINRVKNRTISKDIKDIDEGYKVIAGSKLKDLDKTKWYYKDVLEASVPHASWDMHNN